MLHIKINQSLTVLAAATTLFVLAGCGKQASGNHQSSSNSTTTTSINSNGSGSATTSSLTKSQDHKWHSGFPSVLQGTWVANETTKGGYPGGTGETTISDDSINSEHRFAPVDPVSASGFQYKYDGDNNYTVKNSEYTLSFRLYSNDKIYFSGIRSGNYGDGAIYYRKGSNSSSSTTTKTNSSSPVDNKTAGVLSELFVNPTYFKGGSDTGLQSLYYSEQENDNGNEATKGFSYFTGNGDPTSYYYFKVDNGHVIVKQWEPGKDDVADGHWKVTTIAIDRLLKDYYVTDAQKQEVQGYVNQLKPESSYKVGGNN